jgi:hypothetical protein
MQINEKGIFSLLKINRERERERETEQGKGGAMTGTVFVIIEGGGGIRKVCSSEGYQ